MAINIPTAQEIKEDNLSNLEAAIGQTSPIAAKAFLRVLAAMEALAIGKPLYNFAIEKAKQNLALTATGSDLDLLGVEYGVIRKPSEAAILTATLPGIDTTIIPATIDFIGDSNGVRYSLDASATITGGVATLSLTSEEVGVVGNLQVADTLSIGTQVAGAESTATVTVIDNTGAEEETDDAYRLRVLDAIRNDGGGSNAFDYKTWSEEVAGVTQAYPYAGRFDGPISVPPERTVFVQADTSIDPDSLAPQSLLDEVRTSITTDPLTGLDRQALGLTDETLFISSIIRTTFYVRINNLTVIPSIEAAVKVDLETALSNYLRSITPFVEGIGSVLDRKDLITDLTISGVIQDVLSPVGGSAAGVAFGLTVSTFIASYLLDPGELGKLGSVTYV